ncbi:hypothetical protein ABFO81_09700 [Acinetobacter baumannii]
MSSESNVKKQVDLSLTAISNLFLHINEIQNIFDEQIKLITAEETSGFLKRVDYSFFGIPDIKNFNQAIKEYIDDYKWSLTRLKKPLEEGGSNLYIILDIENIVTELDKQFSPIRNLNQLFISCYKRFDSLRQKFTGKDVIAIINSDVKEIRDPFVNELTEIEKIKIQIINIFPALCSTLGRIADTTVGTNNKLNSIIHKETKNQSVSYDNAIEQIDLLAKNFESNIKLLTEKFETRYKRFVQDTDKLKQTIDLLNKNAEVGLRNTVDLNERVQIMEIDFSQIINEKKKQIDEELENEKINISTKINEAKTALLEEEKVIRNAHKDFLTLVGNAGIYKLTENYNEKAKDEKKEYKRFRRYTSYALIAAILSTFLIFIWAIFDKPDSTYNFTSFLWQPETSNKIDYFLLLSRLSISLMFFVLALYLSKQASKHYECFQENHRTFLQLAALEPFMAKMNEDEQKAIRKGLISTYFNQNADGKFASNTEEVGLPSSLSTPIEKLTEVLKPLIDKASDTSKPN